MYLQDGARNNLGFFLRQRKGMTLAEVLIAMFVITGVAMSVFGLSRQNMRRSMGSAYRAEAYRIAERIAEHAMTLPLSSFTPAGIETSDPVGTAVQWVWTDAENSQFNLSLERNLAGSLDYPTKTTPVVFHKSITAETSPGLSVIVNISISWTYIGNTYTINVPLARGI